mgnify:FL=1
MEKGKRMTGRIFLEAAGIIPALEAISISPTQKDMTPIMVIQSEMASLDESSAALVISGIRPVNAAYTMPVRIIKDQR